MREYPGKVKLAVDGILVRLLANSNWVVLARSLSPPFLRNHSDHLINEKVYRFAEISPR